MSFPPLTGFGKFGLNALGVRLVLAIGECRFGTFGANFGNIPFKMWCKFKNYLTILCPFNQLIQFNDRCSYNSIPPDQQTNTRILSKSQQGQVQGPLILNLCSAAVWSGLAGNQSRTVAWLFTSPSSTCLASSFPSSSSPRHT